MWLKRTEKINIPFIVYEVTPACNYNCKYCYNIWKAPEHKMPSVPTFSQMKKTLRHLFKIADVNGITFSGGEPTMIRRLPELVWYCRLKNKQVVLITNGSGAERQDYETLIKSGVGLFEIPLHSYDPEEHDKMAGKANAWEKSVASIKSILSLKGNVVAVIVITKINYLSVPKTIRFIKELGVQQVMLNRFNVGGEGIKQDTQIGLTVQEMKHAFQLANEAVPQIGIKATANVCTPHCVLNPVDYPQIGFSACYPREINRSWTLDPEGNIRFCNHSPHIVGNIYRTTFKEMLQSDYIRQWREIVPEVCKSCQLFEKCWAGCRAAAEQLGFSLEHADPLVYTLFPEQSSEHKIKRSEEMINV